MIDLPAEELQTVRRILARFVPGLEVRAFGSRVNGNARRHSDLDLAVVDESPLDPDTLRLLREAFEESDLPIRVDVLDWNTTSEGFRKVIERGWETVTAS